MKLLVLLTLASANLDLAVKQLADAYEEHCGSRAIGVNQKFEPLDIDDPLRFASINPKEVYHAYVMLPAIAYQACSAVAGSLTALSPAGDAVIDALALPPGPTVFRKIPNVSTLFGFMPESITCPGISREKMNKLMLQARWMSKRAEPWILHLYQLGALYRYVSSVCGSHPGLNTALTQYLTNALADARISGYSVKSKNNFFQDVHLDRSIDPSARLAKALSFTFPGIVTVDVANQVNINAYLLAVVNDGKLAQDAVMLTRLLQWLARAGAQIVIVSEGVAVAARQAQAVSDKFLMTNPERRGADEEGSKGGGVAFIWQRTLPVQSTHVLVNAEDNLSLSVLKLPNMDVYGMYLQPASDKVMMVSILKAAQRLCTLVNDTPCIIAGDMNCESGTRRRRALDKAMEFLGLRLLNQGQGTYLTRASNVVKDLDLIYTSPRIVVSNKAEDAAQVFPKVRPNDHDRLLHLLETLSLEDAPEPIVPAVATVLAAVQAVAVDGVDVFTSEDDYVEMAILLRLITESSVLRIEPRKSLFMFSLNLKQALDNSNLPRARVLRAHSTRRELQVLTLAMALSGLPPFVVSAGASTISTKGFVWPEGVIVFAATAEELQASFTAVEKALSESGITVTPEAVSHINYPVSYALKLNLRTQHRVKLSRFLPLPLDLHLTVFPSRIEHATEHDEVMRLWFSKRFPGADASDPFAFIERIENEILSPSLKGIEASLSSSLIKEVSEGYGVIRAALDWDEDGEKVQSVAGTLALGFIDHLLHKQGYKWKPLLTASIRKVAALLKPRPKGRPKQGDVKPEADKGWVSTYFASLVQSEAQANALLA